jgi:hypothetical protein
MISLGGVKTTEILAKNLKEQGGNLTAIFQKGGMDDLMGAIKGTPLYDNITKIITDYKELGANK